MPDLSAPGVLSTLADVLIAVAAVASTIIATIALLESRRLLRVANIEVYPVRGEGLMLGVGLRNFGPRYARDIEWAVHIRDGASRRTYEQQVRVPILAPEEIREVVLGVDFPTRSSRSLPALVASGGTLVADWSWRDGRRILWYQRRHRDHLEIELVAILADFTGALERQPDAHLRALERIGTSLEGLSHANPVAEGPKAERTRPARSSSRGSSGS